MSRYMRLMLQLILLAKIMSCEFTNPGTQNEVLILGQPVHVTYRGIHFKNYTIALWQQLPGGGAASLGPAIYQTTHGPPMDSTGLYRCTTLASTTLINSSSGSLKATYSNQGHPSEARQLISGYFTISTAPTSAPASSSLATTSTAPSVTTTSASVTNAPTSQPTETSAPSSVQGISTAGKIGIAVSATAVGLAILLGALACFMRYSSREKRELQDLSVLCGGDYPYTTPYSTPLAPGAEMHLKADWVASCAPYAYASDTQADSGNRQINREPVEMGT